MSPNSGPHPNPPRRLTAQGRGLSRRLSFKAGFSISSVISVANSVLRFTPYFFSAFSSSAKVSRATRNASTPAGMPQ